MAAPLAMAVGAGALAGSAFGAYQEQRQDRTEPAGRRVRAIRSTPGSTHAAYQEHDRRSRSSLDRRRDAEMHQVLANTTMMAQLPDNLRFADESAPIWILLVHVSDVRVGPKLKGAQLRVRVKYGAQGWSLQRETKVATCESTGEDGACQASFNETVVFLWRKALTPVIRIRLCKCSRVERTLGRSEFTFKFTGMPGHHAKELRFENLGWDSSTPSSRDGKLNLVAEMRSISFRDIQAHGVNVGKVVDKPRIASASNMLPLLRGLAVEPAPGFEQQAVAGQLVGDDPDGDPVLASIVNGETTPYSGRLVDDLWQEPSAETESDNSESRSSSISSIGSEDDKDKLCHGRGCWPCGNNG